VDLLERDVGKLALPKESRPAKLHSTTTVPTSQAAEREDDVTALGAAAGPGGDHSGPDGDHFEPPFVKRGESSEKGAASRRSRTPEQKTLQGGTVSSSVDYVARTREVDRCAFKDIPKRVTFASPAPKSGQRIQNGAASASGLPKSKEIFKKSVVNKTRAEKASEGSARASGQSRSLSSAAGSDPSRNFDPAESEPSSDDSDVTSSDDSDGTSDDDSDGTSDDEYLCDPTGAPGSRAFTQPQLGNYYNYGIWPVHPCPSANPCQFYSPLYFPRSESEFSACLHQYALSYARCCCFQ